MLIHKCRLSIALECHLSNELLVIKFKNKSFTIEGYQGPLFKSGRFCIYRLNSSGKISNLYLLDNQNKPYQIYGNYDVLAEGSVIYDDTKEITKNYAYAVQICINSFACLFKNEFVEHKMNLLEFENEIFKKLIGNDLGWKSAKKFAIETLNIVDLPENLITRIKESLTIAPMPKSALTKKPMLNLEEFSSSVLVRI